MRRTMALISAVLFSLGVASHSQQAASRLPRVIRFSGTVSDAGGATVGMTFTLYKDQVGGAPLWQEVQNVAVDVGGHYSAVLGANSQEGVPAGLFMSNEARWLGVQVEQEAEQSRVLLVSVPYALKAGDAETVGGHPLSDFVLSAATPGSGATSGSTGASSNGATKPKSSASPSAPLAATTVNAIAKFSDTASSVVNSQIIDNGTGVGIGSAGTTARLTVGNGTSSEEALHIDGAVPVIRMLSGGALRWGWLGEFPSAGQSTFWNYASGKPLLTLNNGGLVGIGSLNPTARLTVGAGEASTTSEEALHIDGSVPVIRLLSKGNLRWGWLGEFPSAGQSTFWNYASGKPLLTLNNTGRVGIGALNPSSRLTVGDGVSSDEALHVDAGGNAAIRLLLAGSPKWAVVSEFPLAGQLGFYSYTAGRTLLTLDPTGPRVAITGGVSINVPSPTSQLAVGGMIESTTGGYKFPDGTIQLSAANEQDRTRGTTFIVGCDTCSLLADTDSQRAFYVNVLGFMTFQSVTCYSDTGNPVINIQSEIGQPRNILSANLACSPTGATSTSFAVSGLSFSDVLDFVMVTSGGAAHRLTVAIKMLLN